MILKVNSILDMWATCKCIKNTSMTNQCGNESTVGQIFYDKNNSYFAYMNMCTVHKMNAFCNNQPRIKHLSKKWNKSKTVRFTVYTFSVEVLPENVHFVTPKFSQSTF